MGTLCSLIAWEVERLKFTAGGHPNTTHVALFFFLFRFCCRLSFSSSCTLFCPSFSCVVVVVLLSLLLLLLHTTYPWCGYLWSRSSRLSLLRTSSGYRDVITIIHCTTIPANELQILVVRPLRPSPAYFDAKSFQLAFPRCLRPPDPASPWPPRPINRSGSFPS